MSRRIKRFVLLASAAALFQLSSCADLGYYAIGVLGDSLPTIIEALLGASTESA